MNRPNPDQLYAAGLDLYRAGRVAEAESSLRAAISGQPRHADAIHMLAIIGYQRGNAHGAIPLLRRAVMIRPTFPLAWNTLGECYRQIGQVNDALASYRRAIEQDPTMAAPHSNLALVLCETGQTDAGIAAARAAIALDPGLVAAHGILASALSRRGQHDAALATLRQAAALEPANAAVQNNLGTILEATDRLPEAADAYRRAVELDPTLAVSCNNYINVARQLNRWDEALRWTDRALRSDPNFAPARWNHGLLQLTLGDYANGWPNYERRFSGTEQRHPAILTGRPMAFGEDLAGKTLLLYAEQGFGDGFQVARYVPIIARRVGRLVILCHREQARLFARLGDVAAVVTGADPLPAYDRFAGMMSLPYLCGTRSLEAVPSVVPYLSPPPETVERWRARLGAAGGPLKVGLTWNITREKDERRSCPFTAMLPLLDVPGVRWFSLQVGPGTVDLARVPAGREVVDLSAELTDFAETAAAAMQLDLVITVDTAVAHIAGAMARPTWTLVPYSPDWRWMLDRADSPWYPTMRLFRQRERKQWGPVIDTVAAELGAWLAAR